MRRTASIATEAGPDVIQMRKGTGLLIYSDF
jgi:hypothetical protein